MSIADVIGYFNMDPGTLKWKKTTNIERFQRRHRDDFAAAAAAAGVAAAGRLNCERRKLKNS